MHNVLFLMFSLSLSFTTRLTARLRRDEAGQSTAEYALVLLAAAAIAIAVAAWATKTNLIGRLLDVVFGRLASRAGGGA